MTRARLASNLIRCLSLRNHRDLDRAHNLSAKYTFEVGGQTFRSFSDLTAKQSRGGSHETTEDFAEMTLVDETRPNARL